MIWYKAWFETRLRLLLAFAVVVCLLLYMHSMPVTANVPGHRPPVFGIIFTTNLTFIIWIATWLAGAGISTQPAFQATKGVHGSMFYTLSLPVSRTRLMLVRSGFGWLEMVSVLLTFSCAMWLILPEFKSTVSPVVMLEYASTLIAGASVIYFFSVWLATFLEDQFRVFGAISIFLVLQWLSTKLSFPSATDIFGMMGSKSPLVLHSMNWQVIAFSAISSLIFIGVAAFIVEIREY